MGLNTLGRIVEAFTAHTRIPALVHNDDEGALRVRLEMSEDEFVTVATPHVRDWLTPAEHKALKMSADLVGVVAQQVIGSGPCREADINEFAAAVHVVQNMILAQAAARCYPDRYRLMGETLSS